jgi:UPF0271 protein
MARVFLNIDAGEYEDEPEALFELAHVVSIACGGHAGDRASMARALGRCQRFGTRAGAHPSFEDREGFGRRALDVSPEALERSVAAQVQALAAEATALAVPLAYVKPHGALYHAADRDDALARALVRGARLALAPGGASLTVIGPGAGALARAAREQGLPLAREGFADRGVLPDGSLVPRGSPGALVTDPAAAAQRTRELYCLVDTVCVHADTPGSLAIARAVRRELDAAAG